MNTATTAYSDESIRVLRGSLLSRSTQLRERLSKVRGHLRHEAGESPDDFFDIAMLEQNDEVLRAVEKSASAELTHLDSALTRMDEGTFALCECCGKEIEPDRMQVVPYTTACQACTSDR
ncbi:MAG: TraR/DksA C4-type zinc finger protein [Pseudomonadota bacterium]